jgi:hypothetical protein
MNCCLNDNSPDAYSRLMPDTLFRSAIINAVRYSPRWCLCGTQENKSANSHIAS